jgi:hypothetical protein
MTAPATLRRAEMATWGGRPLDPGIMPRNRHERRSQAKLKEVGQHRSGAMIGFLSIELASGSDPPHRA